MIVRNVIEVLGTVLTSFWRISLGHWSMLTTSSRKTSLSKFNEASEVQEAKTENLDMWHCIASL